MRNNEEKKRAREKEERKGEKRRKKGSEREKVEILKKSVYVSRIYNEHKLNHMSQFLSFYANSTLYKVNGRPAYY